MSKSLTPRVANRCVVLNYTTGIAQQVPRDKGTPKRVEAQPSTEQGCPSTLTKLLLRRTGLYVTDVTLFTMAFYNPCVSKLLSLYSGTNTLTLWTNSSTLTGTVVIANTVQLTLRQKNPGEKRKKRVFKKRRENTTHGGNDYG